MTTYRSIDGIYTGAPFQIVGDGFRVSNYFPSGNRWVERFSPFILLDYGAPHYFPPTTASRGVGAHPHRGFETVTIAYEGHVEHHDNAGSHGVIGPGDVQWMTAGSGLLHKEYQEQSFTRHGGVMHMIQLWVNLPREHKMTAPSYQTLLDADMGRAELPDGGGTLRVIAGEVMGIRDPARTFTPVSLFDISFRLGGEARFTLPASHNAGILVLRGRVRINESVEAAASDFVLFQSDDGEIAIHGLTEDALVLVLGGKPIDEPVVQHGPFVMNTREEIVQAFENLRTGKFGNPNF